MTIKGVDFRFGGGSRTERRAEQRADPDVVTGGGDAGLVPGVDISGVSSSAPIIAAAVSEMTSYVELNAQAAVEGAIQAEDGARAARRAAECALMEVELLAARATAGLNT